MLTITKYPNKLGYNGGEFYKWSNVVLNIY